MNVEKGVSDLNQNIDITCLHLNYNLAQELQPLHPEAFIKNRLKEVNHINRKDVNVMVDWIVTLPKSVPQEDEQKFFEHTYQFMKKEYAEKKNIISAWCINLKQHLIFISVLYLL